MIDWMGWDGWVSVAKLHSFLNHRADTYTRYCYSPAQGDEEKKKCRQQQTREFGKGNGIRRSAAMLLSVVIAAACRLFIIDSFMLLLSRMWC